MDQPEVSYSSSAKGSQASPGPADNPFALEAKYQADPSLTKVNLGIGAYRDDDGKPWVLSAVREARKDLAAGEWSHEYSPLVGHHAFLSAAKHLLFKDCIDTDCVASIQTVSGTGANSLVTRFANTLPHRPKHIWLPNPTWENHLRIWRLNAPGIVQRDYPYYDACRSRLNYEGMIDTLMQSACAGDVVLLHGCAHNPTGLDPDRDQWKGIADVCRKKGLIVIFDVAYQGFASGDLDQDAWAVRHFITSRDLNIAVCQSFSKNMGMYGDRVGALHVIPRVSGAVLPTVAETQNRLIELQLGNVSTAPRFGAEIADRIMTSTYLLEYWRKDLTLMSNRIKKMRGALYKDLVALETPGDWSHITAQKGMFSYTGLNRQQVDILRINHHVYMLSSGRISICGLNSGNVASVARAIDQVVRETLETR